MNKYPKSDGFLVFITVMAVIMVISYVYDKKIEKIIQRIEALEKK